ncbi:hypothetical protein [Aliiglaciecola litoralis]|uniref:DUF1439 domain-containing protein n=1 Tax=Aliiglaciecola litoralis TaxID=582857 RepID=A0ABN1LEA0_9ALTE
MKKSLYMLFVAVCLLTTFHASAFVLTVSEKQLNNMLKLTFPIVREYQGIYATFADPMVQLDALDQKVLITTTITAVQDGKTLKARGTIEGVFDYDPLDQQLRFEKPSLKDFTILENNIEGAEHAVRTLKQTIGRNLPVILLVDFKQLDFGLGSVVPREIDITPLGLAITL